MSDTGKGTVITRLYVMKEIADNLCNHFAAIALSVDENKILKERKELWEAKEKVRQAIELAALVLKEDSI